MEQGKLIYGWAYSPPPHVETVNFCFVISLIILNVNRPLNQFLAIETEFIVNSRMNSCTVNKFFYGPPFIKTKFKC